MRTMTTDDLESYLPSVIKLHKASIESSYWPCIVFGELLGQGDQLTNIDAVALSRASACFSFSQARADELHGAQSLLAERCEKRLRILESDRLFVRRSISIDELAPIWEWTRASTRVHSVQQELSQLVEDAVNGRLAEGTANGNGLLNSVGFNARSLSTGTAEARVRSFQAFAQSLEAVRQPEIVRTNAMLLAAAAICVGNGTSHISLLEDFGKRVPAAYAWFGLFAAIAGPRGWDPSWNRAINSMGRILRNRFELTEAPVYDLSWVEYDFVREVPKPSEFLKHVPKLYPRLLSVEVIPGATCQLRLSDDSPRPSPPRVEESKEQAPTREVRSYAPSPQFMASLHELERTLARSQALLRQAIVAGEERVPSQSALFDTSASRPKKRSQKKGSKTSDLPE